MLNNFKVILIGGSPMSGKTTLAKRLSKEYGYMHISTDDIGEILSTIADINPMKGFDYREYYIQKSQEELKADLLAYHLHIHKSVKRLVEIHSNWGEPMVIEGWALYPELLSEISHPNISKLWLICDEKVLEQRLKNDIEFVSGASDEELMRDKYLQRSIWHNAKIFEECKKMNEYFISVFCQTTEEMVFDGFLGVVMKGK